MLERNKQQKYEVEWRRTEREEKGIIKRRNEWS
jgi:hypothetical protein